MRDYNFYVYIITTPDKTVLYIGVTNNLERRMQEHTENSGKTVTFAGKYHCYNLVYYEHFTHIEFAILREKELKKWSRKKKEQLIETENPQWLFLNNTLSL